MDHNSIPMMTPPQHPETSWQFPERMPINPRQMWAINRFWTETQNLVTKRYGGKRSQHWTVLFFMMQTFQLCLKIVGWYERGVRNAEAIVVREMDLAFEQLPPAFEGFTLLHLSDLHLDGMPGLAEKIVELASPYEVDLCVLTGDYRTKLHGPIDETMNHLRFLVSGIRSRQGFLGVLGNHDDCHMVAPMEDMGIRMLINESCALERAGQKLQVIGTDDVHYYYTDQALHALESARQGFTIALIHSPELYEEAARMGVALYLCGHTHGGQVCLPGGRKIITHLNRGHAFYKGYWIYQGMQGITHCGVGTSGIPVRFNTQGEILLLRLHRKP